MTFYYIFIIASISNNSATALKKPNISYGRCVMYIRILLSSNLYYKSDLSKRLSGRWHYLEKTSFVSSRYVSKMFLFPNDFNTTFIMHQFQTIRLPLWKTQTLVMADVLRILLSSNLYYKSDLSKNSFGTMTLFREN